MASGYKRQRFQYVSSSSDKEYQITIEVNQNGFFDVVGRYGRTGQGLPQKANKILNAPFHKAIAEYKKVVSEKTRKGYTLVSTDDNLIIDQEDSPKQKTAKKRKSIKMPPPDPNVPWAW